MLSYRAGRYNGVLEDCEIESLSMVKQAVCVKIRKHRYSSQRRNLLVAEN